MKKELKQIATQLKELAILMEEKIEWGDTDWEDIIREINSYAEDIKNLAKTAIDLDDLKAVDSYEKQAENLVENAINKELEDND
jgi:hypothetical protein